MGIARKDTLEPQGPSIEQRLSAAQATARTARAHLDGLTARLHKAVEEERYGDAEAVQNEIPAAEIAHTHASADVHAIEFAVAELGRERAERDARIAAEKRKQAAQGILNAAHEREMALMDDLAAVKAEIEAGLGAVRDAVARGQGIEGQVRQARSDKNQAYVDLGERAPGMYISAPNIITVMVDQTPALLALIRNHPLVGR